MPIGVNMPEENQLVHMLLVGNSKVGKTHYAMRAAEDGFNVLYIDGDASRPTIRQASKDALSRTFYLQFGDAVSDTGVYVPRFALLLRKFLSTGKFQWDDTLNRSLVPNDPATVGNTIVELNAAHLNANWVVVIDSWTSISHSIMSAVAMNAGVDLADMDRAGQSIYASANNLATDLVSRIRALNCHVIVIAHPDEYVKYRVKSGSVKEAQRTENREVEYARTIPKSISRPHGQTLASYFTDVGWLEISPMGKRIINFETSKDRDGGGRFSGKYPVDECSFASLVKRAGGAIPSGLTVLTDSALTITPSWESPAGTAQPNVMSAQTGSTLSRVQLGVAPAPMAPAKHASESTPKLQMKSLLKP